MTPCGTTAALVTPMGFVIALIIGLVAGALARQLFVPERQRGGAAPVLLLGAVGAVVAYGFGATAGWYSRGEGPAIIAAAAGATLALYLGRGLALRRAWGP
jgi:uncharacterized membrane protein YeaQ/YmgE (transglycosylase-associated protein family)